MEIKKVENEQVNVRKVREKSIPNTEINEKIQLENLTEEQKREVEEFIKKSKVAPVQNLNTVVPESILNLDYPIEYEPLCKGKILGIPKKLHYKPIDGFMVAKINDLSLETIDDGIHFVLDSLCLESKQQGFTHWLMTTDEKIRAYLNLRLNTSGNVIEHLFGICTECGKEKLFLKIKITNFDSIELKDEYIEPFPLKVTIGKEEVKFKSRLIQSGDIYKAKNTYLKDKAFIDQMFEMATEKEEKIVIQILEYANTILSINDQNINYKKAVEFCKNNVSVMNAITAFNDYFYYGIQLKAEDHCDNKECSSYSIDEKTKKSVSRGCQFRIPLQPNIFYISHTEKEAAKQYFDL